MARSRSRSKFFTAGLRVAAIAAAATLFGALLSPSAAFAVDPEDAVISGTVTATAGGAPLELVTVVAENYDDGSTYEGATEADGSYSITDLPAGPYTVSFQAPEGTDYVSEWYNNVLSIDDATVFTLAQSQARQVNAGLALGGKLTGTVTGTAGAKLADVLVEVYAYGGNSVLASGYTAADGAYLLRGIPTSGISISFTDDADRGYITKWSTNRASQAAADKILVPSGGTATANAAMVIGGSISGRVTGPGGSALDEGSIEVDLTLAGSTGDDVLASEYIDQAGAYRFSGLAAGSYVVQFTDLAEAGLAPQWWNNADTRQKATAVSLTAAQDRTGINATMTTGASISGTVSGESDSTPVPLAESLVTLYTIGEDFVAETQTDAQGAYSLTGLASGAYRLSFDAPDGGSYGSEWWQDKPDFDSATTITVQTGQALVGYSAELSSGGAITGVVTGSDSAGAGIEGVDVTAFDDFGDEAGAASTDADGVYLIDGLPAGEYRVQFTTADVPTYAPQWWKNKPTMDEALTVTVTNGVTTTSKGAVLQLGGTVGGLVTGSDAPATGLADIEVTAYDETGSEISATETADDGTFTLRGIPAGRVTLGYHDPSNPSVYLDEFWNDKSSREGADYFTATAASTITGRNAVLSFGASVSGTVTGDDAPDVPLDGVTVELFDLGHEYVADAVTGTDGTYRFAPLAAGSYKLSFTGPDGENYGSEWWNDAASFTTATTITLAESASATASAGLVANPEQLDDPPAPGIAGEAEVGGTVTVVPGEWGPAPVELSYQWNSDDEPIAGATGASFDIGADYFETALSVTVTGGKLGYLPRSVTSDPTGPVTAGQFPDATPLISGTLAVGKTLAATPGDWGVSDTEFSYRWQNNGTNISNAFASTYKLRSSDAGDRITVTVTGTAYGYDDRAQASASETIGKVLTKTSTPTITGTGKVGKTLTASHGSWKPSKVSFSYQWKRNGVAIKGAVKSSYKAGKSDRNKKITVTVTGAKAGYTAVSKTSKSKKIH